MLVAKVSLLLAPMMIHSIVKNAFYSKRTHSIVELMIENTPMTLDGLLQVSGGDHSKAHYRV